MKRFSVLTAISALTFSALAQDTILFSTGRTYDCEIIKYENGAFTVKLPDGAVKEASVKSVKSIIFAANEKAINTSTSNVPPETTRMVATNPPFRNIQWGMSMEEVKKVETSKLLEEKPDLMNYQDSVNGLDTWVLYIFVDNRLVRAGYYFIERHSNKTDYISDYKTLDKSLTQKYGRPVHEDTIWKNDLYQDDPEDWGMALSVGHLVMLEKWETLETIVEHVLSGDNFDIIHVVNYRSKALGSLEELKKSKIEKNKI